MLGLARVRSLFDQLQGTYWFLPSLLTAAAIGAALLLVSIDRTAGGTSSLSWAYGGGADGARALLSAVAGSMITVVSVTFSVLVVALTVSSQHFGPRLLRSFMRDQPAQVVLGAFTGTFAYCLVVLRTVEGDDGAGGARFVPHLAVTAAVVAALTAVGLLIYYVHHVAVSMQLTEITNRVTRELERAMDRLYPESIGQSPEPPARRLPEPPPDAIPIPAPADGYLQEIDSERILRGAVEHDATIWLSARPGDFVVRGAPLGRLEASGNVDAAVAHVRAACIIGIDRTTYQDVGLGVQQLVEIVLRALSPGTNEPFTAISAIHRLEQALSRLAGRRFPDAARADDEGRVRVISPSRTFEQFADDAFGPIADYGGDHPLVLVEVFAAMARIVRRTRRREDAAAIQRLADRIRAAADRTLEDPARRQLIAQGYERVRAALEETPPTVQEALMERDVVCGMQVDPAKAAGTSEYNGKTYYFCSNACKAKFDANPSQFAT